MSVTQHEDAMPLESPVTRHFEVPSTRDLILAAAEQQFAERGFTGVAMRDIAADAGLKNQASLYHHFRNKRALYEAVLAHGLGPIVELMIESSTSTPDAATRRQVVDAVLDRLLDYLAQHPHLPRLIQRAGLDESRYMRNTMSQLLVRFYTVGLGALAGTGGPWQKADLPHVAVGLYHLIFGYFADAVLLEMLLQSDPRSPEAVARQREFVKTAVAQVLGFGSES